MPTEADARILVDRLLREAGWDVEDKSQVSTEETFQAAACSRVLLLADRIEGDSSSLKKASKFGGGGKMSRAEHQALR